MKGLKAMKGQAINGWRIAAITSCALAAGACSPPDGGEIFDKANLTSSQRATAEAMIEGQMKASVIPVLRQRDYLMAACYATKVDMPNEYSQAHRAYLADDGQADEDFYGFFARYNLSEEAAYSLYERYEAAFKECSPW